jgi:competence protein ComEC
MAARAAWISFAILCAACCALCASELLEVFYIDVGHGDAILVDCGDWEALIDAGTESNKLEASANLKAVLESCVTDGVLDLVILTHWHEDHTSLLAQVLGRYTVVSAWHGCDASAAAILEAYIEGGLPKGFEQPAMLKLVMGQHLETGCLLWTALGPAVCADGSTTDKRAINNSSLVLFLRYEDTAFLFAGDQLVLSTAEMPEVDPGGTELVLLAPHHGYEESALQALYCHFSPDLVVFSTDAWPPIGADTLCARHTPFLATSRCGLVHLASDGHSVWASRDTLARAVMPTQCADTSSEGSECPGAE